MIALLGLIVIFAFKGTVAVLLILTGSIIYRKIKYKEKFKIEKEHIGILIFLLLIGLSFITSINREASLGHYNRIIRAVISPIIIYNIVPFNKKYFDYMFILGGLILAFFGISQYFFELIPYNGGSHARIDAGYGIWYYSYYITFISVYIFNLFILEEEKKKKNLLLIASLITIFAVLISNTRSAWLAMVIGIFTALLINKKIKQILVIIGLSLVLILTFKETPVIKKYIIKVQSIVEIKKNTSNAGRFEVWKDAYSIFKENPVLGVGISNYDRASKKEYKIQKRYYSAHSDYLGLLCETGIVGFMGFLIMLWIMFREAYKKKKLNLLLSVTSVLLFLGIFESNMNKNTYVYVIYFILYSIINYGKLENKVEIK
ncbi:O-antigen ligase family protein [Psychrilyobacter sp.]|uniref:O-antigen ligase family protein n=1 Tax=Psychrilyobacter sp. TaxID=2586924 RepID=UPI003017F119